MYRVKICGIRSLRDARIAIKAGADALGFLVGTRYYAEDRVSPKKVREILDSIEEYITDLSSVAKVLVTHQVKAEDILWILELIGFDYVQLHDAIAIKEIKRLRKAAPSIKIVKAIHGNGENPIETALMYAEHVDAIVVDTMSKNRNRIRIGGTGRTHDWNVTARIVEKCPVPVILAGGLNPENVSYAIKHVIPYGVDVNSGVEDRKGNKEPGRVKVFVETAKGLLLETAKNLLSGDSVFTAKGLLMGSEQSLVTGNQVISEE